MRASFGGSIGPILWIGAEIIAYAIVFQQFGVGIALLIGLLSLAIGITALRRLGFGLIGYLEQGFARPDTIIAGAKHAGLAALGAILLILPGVLSNAAGGILLLANYRAWLFPPQISEHDSLNTVELEPGEWRVEPGKGEPLRPGAPDLPRADSRN